MAKDELFLERDYKEIWQKYCGFLALSLNEFMEIQEDLLLEEIELVADTLLGKKIMQGRKPTSIAEFRSTVPLTTFDDYAEFLQEKRDDALAEKPYRWVHTSGRSGSFKWAPYTERAFNKAMDALVASFILACANKKGQVNFTGRERCVQNLPARPYFSAELALSTSELFNFRIFPPLAEAEKMEFQERIAKSFEMSMKTGVDIIASITSVLIKIGESFSEKLEGRRFSPFMLHPFVLFRLTRAQLISKIQKRSLLPKDLWPVKAILCSGTDATVYRDLVVHYWGKEPYQFYVGTEASFTALQSWTKKAFTFWPYSHFIELIPEAEWLKWRENREYQPSTILLDEVKPGERYELVATSFYGMPFLRYRVGDLIKIVSLRDEETGINIPQMDFESRADDLVDIAGFTRLDEKTVWQAINNTKIRYEDWCIRREHSEGQEILHLYIEIKDDMSREKVQSLLHRSLKEIDSDYNDLMRMLKLRPLRVTLLSRGTFEHYTQEKRAAGFDLAHLKPRHMNPSDVMISDLLRLSKEGVD